MKDGHLRFWNLDEDYPPCKECGDKGLGLEGGCPECGRLSGEELETQILFLKRHGLPDSRIIQSLENPLSRRKGFSKKEIEQAIQNLRNYGFLDKQGLITEEGINAINDVN